jgi:adenylosuccinate synthase
MVVEISDIIIGCGFGDEGKGKVVYDLLKDGNYQLCVRFNGSGNAGHTIYRITDKRKFVVHQLPVGILVPGVFNLISSDCLIDIERLKMEIDELKEKGIDTDGRIFISKACHIITQDCIDYDRNNNKIGTTGSGIGPTYSQKMLRIGKRAEDYEEEFHNLNIHLVDMRKFWYSKFVIDCIKTVLLEGAQGFELDINWTNNYPYCTSSTCTIGGAINTGISLTSIRNIYGIAKSYDTYVGTMSFQPEEYDNELNLIANKGFEYGSTTGRKRQCNFLNLDNLIEALALNSCNQCIINKTDILMDANIFKLYYDGKLISFENIDLMCNYIRDTLEPLVDKVIFSFNPYTI